MSPLKVCLFALVSRDSQAFASFNLQSLYAGRKDRGSVAFQAAIQEVPFSKLLPNQCLYIPSTAATHLSYPQQPSAASAPGVQQPWWCAHLTAVFLQVLLVERGFKAALQGASEDSLEVTSSPRRCASYVCHTTCMHL